MADVPQVKYYHDASSTYELFAQATAQGEILFPGLEVSPATGVVKAPTIGSAARAFDQLTISALLSNADWFALRADLKAATTYGATYPYIDYTYEAGSTISLKVAVTAFSWAKVNEQQHRVTLTFRERKA